MIIFRIAKFLSIEKKLFFETIRVFLKFKEDFSDFQSRGGKKIDMTPQRVSHFRVLGPILSKKINNFSTKKPILDLIRVSLDKSRHQDPKHYMVMS